MIFILLIYFSTNFKIHKYNVIHLLCKFVPVHKPMLFIYLLLNVGP